MKITKYHRHVKTTYWKTAFLIALAGLFWSNWCEYNYRFGVDFGEYSLLQYRYAKIYARKSLEEGQ